MSFEDALMLWMTPMSSCVTWRDTVIYSGCVDSLYLNPRLIMAHCWSSHMESVVFEFKGLYEPVIPISVAWPPTVQVYPFEDSPLRQDTNDMLKRFAEIEPLPIGERSYLRSTAYNVQLDDRMSKHYLFQNGIAICEQQNMELEELCIVHGNEFYFEAINFDDCSEEHPPVYFHVSPMEGGQIPVPWGYFSFDPMPVDDGKDILMRPSHWPEGTDDYESVLPGVVAFVRTKISCEYLHLTALQATALRYIHNNFHPSESENSSGSGRFEVLA